MGRNEGGSYFCNIYFPEKLIDFIYVKVPLKIAFSDNAPRLTAWRRM